MLRDGVLLLDFDPLLLAGIDLEHFEVGGSDRRGRSSDHVEGVIAEIPTEHQRRILSADWLARTCKHELFPKALHLNAVWVEAIERIQMVHDVWELCSEDSFELVWLYSVGVLLADSHLQKAVEV